MDLTSAALCACSSSIPLLMKDASHIDFVSLLVIFVSTEVNVDPAVNYVLQISLVDLHPMSLKLKGIISATARRMVSYHPH
jgi:hypothetical protein